MLKLDIIIPVYNAEKYLENCIKSIKLHENKNIRAILVNDGSTDNSLELCNKFKGEYDNVVVINQGNSGVSVARNTGLSHIIGDYITFMDPDDQYEDGYIKKCLEEIEKYGYPDVAITSYKRVYGQERIENNLFSETESTIFAGTDILKKLYGMSVEEVVNPATINDLSPVWGKFYKQEIISNKKFLDVREVGSEDLWFNIETFCSVNSVLYIPKYYYLYTKNNSRSLTTNFDKSLLKSWERLFYLIRKLAVKKKYTEEYFERLDIRQYLSKMSLILVVFNSKNLTVRQKLKLAKEIAIKPEYSKYKYSDFPNMVLKWKLLMWLCDGEHMFSLYCIIRLLEPYKSKLK